MRFRGQAILCLLACLGGFASGCAGTDTGNPSDGRSDCEVIDVREIELDERTPLGFSAEAVWRLAEGAHTTTLRWDGGEPVHLGELQATETQLALRLTRRAGRAPRYVQRTASEGNVSRTVGPCRDQLELDVHVQLESADGALDQAFDAVLFARDAFAAEWSVRLEPERWRHTLAVESTPTEDRTNSDWDLPEGLVGGAVSSDPYRGEELQGLRIECVHTAAGLQGVIEGEYQGEAENQPGLMWEASVEYGAFSQGPFCSWDLAMAAPVAFDAKVYDFSLQDALDVFREEKPRVLTWEDGTQTELELTVARSGEPYACVDRDSRALGATLEMTIRTADGVVDGQWPVDIHAYGDEQGGLQEVSLWWSERGPKSEVLAAAGIHGVELPSHPDAWVSFLWEWSALDDSPAGGLLEVLNVDGTCAEPCEVVAKEGKF